MHTSIAVFGCCCKAGFTASGAAVLLRLTQSMMHEHHSMAHWGVAGRSTRIRAILWCFLGRLLNDVDHGEFKEQQ
jgi:hypothetical protein